MPIATPPAPAPVYLTRTPVCGFITHCFVPQIRSSMVRGKRPRAGSISRTIDGVDALHAVVPDAGRSASSPRIRSRSRTTSKPPAGGSLGLWKDLYSMRWMTVPESSFKLLLIPASLYLTWEIVACFIVVPISNPFARLLFISHSVVDKDGTVSYAKGYNDLWFIAYWVICFSFIRLFWTVYIFHPLARWFGIQSRGKINRFGEQGYAVVYYGFMGALGVYVMTQLPTWYFNCQPQWTEYPQWQMTPVLKSYYLLHFAYWIQQFLVLALRLEKPRKDHTEYIIHHFVTIWMIGWSYLINLTWIGNMVFVTMDWTDVFIAAAKVCHYLKRETAATWFFAIFATSWTYARHYLNLYLLYSVWTEFDLIPVQARQWSPKDGVWLAGWMKYQIFGPMALLQLVNLLWYYRVLRTLYRAVFESRLDDERSDDEDDGEDEDAVDARRDD